MWRYLYKPRNAWGSQKRGKRMGHILSHSSWKEPTLATPWFWTFGLQNWATIHFFYSKPPSCDICYDCPLCCLVTKLCPILWDSMDCSMSAACQASLSFTISWSLFKIMSIELVTPSNHLILCRPLLLLPSIFPSIRVFSNELAPHIRWPKYWSFSCSISPSNEYSWLP